MSILNGGQKMKETGLPNYVSAQIPLHSGLKMDKWKFYLQNSPCHADLLKFLEYGFPLNYISHQPPKTDQINHSSAMLHPDHVENHIKVELEHQGPFYRKGKCIIYHLGPVE